MSVVFAMSIIGVTIFGIVSFKSEAKITKEIDTIDVLSLCDGQYDTGDFHLIVNENNYTLLSNDENNYFSGTCEKYTGNDISKYLSDAGIYQTGLNPDKINYNNLVYLKLNFNEHVYDGNIEYFNHEINNADVDYIQFLIYFVNNDDGNTYAAAHCLDDITISNMSQSYF